MAKFKERHTTGLSELRNVCDFSVIGKGSDLTAFN